MRQRRGTAKSEKDVEFLALMIQELVTRMTDLERDVKRLRERDIKPEPGPAPWDRVSVADEDLEKKFMIPHWQTKDDPKTVWRMEPRVLGFFERAWMSVKRWWMR